MKTAIITGGARGIGKAISIALAKNGYNVVINYNTSEKQALELQEYIEKSNGIAEIFKADLTKREEVKRLIQFHIFCYHLEEQVLIWCSLQIQMVGQEPCLEMGQSSHI